MDRQRVFVGRRKSFYNHSAPEENGPLSSRHGHSTPPISPTATQSIDRSCQHTRIVVWGLVVEDARLTFYPTFYIYIYMHLFPRSEIIGSFGDGVRPVPRTKRTSILEMPRRPPTQPRTRRRHQRNKCHRSFSFCVERENLENTFGKACCVRRTKKSLGFCRYCMRQTRFRTNVGKTIRLGERGASLFRRQTKGSVIIPSWSILRWPFVLFTIARRVIYFCDPKIINLGCCQSCPILNFKQNV